MFFSAQSVMAEIGPGERTGTYRRGVGRLLSDVEGRSEISAEDFAVGLVDELEKGAAADRHITFAH
jgi:putative NADH-flavin reductase